MTNLRPAVCIALALIVSAPVFGAAVQDDDGVALVTVVGCLRQDSGDLPWILEKATEGTPARTAFTSQDELKTSAEQPLGSLEYRLIGVGEFGVEGHAGHKVQVKGLKLEYEGELRLNITSFQHLGDCQ